jgi:PBP1b-binding outer membrane lipoprotein LpoB
MQKIAALLALAVLLGGCANYTERTSPCVCAWEPISAGEEAVL